MPNDVREVPRGHWCAVMDGVLQWSWKVRSLYLYTNVNDPEEGDPAGRQTMYVPDPKNVLT